MEKTGEFNYDKSHTAIAAIKGKALVGENYSKDAGGLFDYDKDKSMLTFSNPRLKVVIPDYPSGGKRVTCVFEVHRNKRGYRVSRTTTGKPKFTTYGGQTAIVDGSDGRTYILRTTPYNFILVSRWDFMDASQEMGNASVFPESNPELYQQLMQLIVQGKSSLMPIE